jgi:hypothetical protein
MIVVINGSFGVGKTTVARLLREAFPGSAVYDPEWAGLALMRLPRWVGLRGAGTDDFQDIELWRRLTVAGVRLFGLFADGALIVPMTFSRRDYLDEVVAGLRRHDPATRVFCLRAGLPTVRGRLAGRGTKLEGPGSQWIARRIVECAEAHRDPHFGEPVDTEGRSAREVAEHIAARLRRPDAPNA